MPRRRKGQQRIGANGGQLLEEDRHRLNGYVGELEYVASSIDELKSDAREICRAAGEAGFDVKAIKAVVREKRADAAKLRAYQTVLDAYRLALGMLADTPLGQAAMRKLAPPKAPFVPPSTHDAPFHPPDGDMPDIPAAPA